jgi:hypothetical protein
VEIDEELEEEESNVASVSQNILIVKIHFERQRMRL